MKIIVTTSDNYHHCLPVFFLCYNKHWGDEFELVGYKKPENLPPNCTFISLGKQRGPKYFSDDMAAYFRNQPPFFVWMMEDTFIKGFDRIRYDAISSLTSKSVGRINLTNEGMRREHTVEGEQYKVHDNTMYRLSTQPSIWNRDYLLKYMTPGLSPWDFETQETTDNYLIIGPMKNIVSHNEGVRRHDITKLNLEGL